VAQLGSALRSGRRGPGFKSRLPDHEHLQVNLKGLAKLAGPFSVSFANANASDV
jgi:hypothetical protein